MPQALKLGQANGHQYGGPYTFSTPTLFYNADLPFALEDQHVHRMCERSGVNS